MTAAFLGTPEPLLAARDHAAGRTRYLTDLDLPGMVHGAVVRSPHARARVTGLDFAAAAALPGVLACIGPGDLPPREIPGEAFYDRRISQRPVFFAEPPWAGAPVAAVVAETAEAARAAAAAVRIDYDVLPATADLEAALTDAPPAGASTGHLAMPFGSLRWQRGDPDGVFACAAHLLSDTFTTSTVQAAAMEPYAVVVQPERATVTVHHGTPAPFHLREQIAAWLGFGLTDVRVVSPPVGGGFGSRMDDLPFVATALALRCRRPVRLVLPRSEGFVSGRVRHGARITVRSALDAEGNLVARELDAVYDVGGHLDLGPYVILRALRPLALYRCEHLRFVGRLVYTNRPVSSATRGFGNPQASFAVESHNDRLCSELGLDPAAFRRRHLLASGDVNVSVGRVDTAIGAFQPTGALIGSCEVRACLDRVLDALAHRPRPDRDRLLRGTGIACAMHTTGKGRKELSTAAVTRTADGVIVESGAPDQGGTGVATSLAMIAGEVLGVPLEAIEVRLGDTATELHDSGAHASGRTYVAGAAVHGAACRVRERLDAGAALPVRERVAHRPSTNAPPFACCGAAVAVDPDTGTVKVEGLVVAVDIGRVLNPMHARGQVTGAVVQGIGYALWERLDFGPDGRLLTAGMYDYGVPRPADVPPIEVHFVDGHEPSHPAGVKGVGEIGLMAVAPAIANAVFDATGARIRDLPITAEKVWSALRDSSRNHRPARTSGP